MNRFSALLFAGLALYPFCFTQLDANGQALAPALSQAPERLRFALVLTRHGVRSPTWTNARLNEYSTQPWPEWPVAPGLLTPHGKQLMSLFGGYYRESFAARGLISPPGCADAAHVFIDADTDERTVETGHGLADGMFPGCAVAVHSLSADGNDSLFHSGDMGAAINPATAVAALSGRIGDDPGALLSAYEVPLEAMQQLLFACGTRTAATTLCNTAAKKNLLSLEPRLGPGSGDHLVEIKGPLMTGATFAENLQLEYLEGMPEGQVGWGRADEKTVRSLMTLHSVSSDLVQRTPYIARMQASNLLRHIIRTLAQAEQRKSLSDAVGAPDDKVVFLVGHDTNIANVAALLDAHWLVAGYQRDDAAPGGALVFELWQRSGLPDAVRVYYTVQSPRQMRQTLPLSLASPPSKADIFLPGCSKDGPGLPCDWPEFERMAESRSDYRTQAAD